MSDVSDLLVEIGTEELPPRSVIELSNAFAAGVADGLDREGLSHGAVTSYATPRRLAVLINEVQNTQEEHQTESGQGQQTVERIAEKVSAHPAVNRQNGRFHGLRAISGLPAESVG